MTTIRKFRNRYGDVAYVRADFADAASTIEISLDAPDAWQQTPHQVADARHRPAQALRLAMLYLMRR